MPRTRRSQTRWYVFRVGPYDKNKALVIDPVLVYGTYIDGTQGFDAGTSLLVDSAGFAYIGGYTGSTDFPTTLGAYKRQITTANNYQVFVSKLSHDGSSLIWSTIVGGSGPYNYALPNSFALDDSGDVYIVGSTADVTYSGNGTPTYYPSTFPTLRRKLLRFLNLRIDADFRHRLVDAV